jgi:poly-gamma-glutamate synthesis protein (capsule biosynthesis protein)
VGDLDTKDMILEKNQDSKLPIASLSKLMTAAISKEVQDPAAIITVSKRAIAAYGGNGNLLLNEKIKAADLLYPLLLESSNDAAEALAESVGRDSFILKMNQKAEILEMTSTSFSDPSGLSPENRSTALDLFKFSEYLKKNLPVLLQISALKSYKDTDHIWFSNNQFLNFPGYQGGKRGYTDEAGQTALALFSLPLGEKGKRNIGIVILRSPDRYKDVKNILDYLNQNVYYGKATEANSAWVKSRENIFEERNENYLTFLFGGDIMLDRGVKNSVSKNFNGDYSVFFEKLKILESADAAFANLEGPASDQGADRHNLYSFRMDPSVVPALKGIGFDILSVANNHMGDWGREAYADTLARLKENEINYVGGSFNEVNAENPVILEKNGMKIGFLAFSDVGPEWLRATPKQAGLLLADSLDFDEIIKRAAQQTDFLIVSFHFGEEYQAKHNARQEHLAHRAIDAGAKIVVGSHPHIIQDTEIYKNGFIAYSLGNLIFDQNFSPETMRGMLLKVQLFRDGNLIVTKNIVKLNSLFQPDKIISGKLEKIKFKDIKIR